MNWYVLCVKTGREQKIANILDSLGVTVFCPTVTETHQWSDRKKKVTTALFKSYVFVRLTEQNRPISFEVPGVIKYLFWLGRPVIVRDDEIETIRQWLVDDSIDELNFSSFAIGSEIIIEKGILKNRKAIVQKVGAKRLRLVLSDMGIVVNAQIREIV